MKMLLLSGIIIVLSSILAYTLFESPHEFSKDECLKCHVDTIKDPKKMRAPITELCLPCHKSMDPRSSHPVDVIPELKRVPEDLPLTNGMITCNTCHNVHDRRFSALGKKTYFLRRTGEGKDFCLLCHDIRTAADGHVEVIAAAHRENRYIVVDRSQLLDPLSMDCITCHDGSAGKGVDFQYSIGVWNHTSGSHPIGVLYKTERMRKGGLRPLELLDKRIRLFDGKVGCGSCHDIYSNLPMHLVMSNEYSRLCFSCHEK